MLDDQPGKTKQTTGSNLTDLERVRAAKRQEKLEDEAIEWVARLRADDVSEPERAEFAVWLSRSEAHKAAFDAMLDMWEKLGALGTQSPVQSPVVNPEPATAPVQSVGTGGAALKKRWQFPLALAATVLLASVVVLFATLDPSYSTEAGEQRQIVLEDGSQIFLNTATRLTVRYSRSERLVEMAEGEAFFDVTSNPERPFIVSDGRLRATAVGTAFVVRSVAGVSTVDVTEGRVRVLTHDTTTLLEPAERLQVTERSGVKSTYALSDAHTWRIGQLVYDRVKLSELIDDLNRYVERPMMVSDPALRDTRVSAVLQLDDQAAMLDALSQSLGLRWSVVSDKLVVLRPGK